MTENSEGIQQLGYDDWFQQHSDAEKKALHSIARVISVHRESYQINNGESEVFAELAGRLAYRAQSATDLPTTGDWVYADFYDDDSHAVIHDVLPRKTLLARKAAGKSIDYQLIAANIDVAFIMQSADYNFNPRRLERYLVMVSENHIKPVILLSKCDLISQQQREWLVRAINEVASDLTVLPFSNQNGENLDTIKNLMQRGLSYCLLGSSGVGKTSLLNKLTAGPQFETSTVSKKHSKGRHTTTSRELIQLSNGAMLIDTPGMRELGSLAVDAGIEETFAEITELATQCRFSNCSHIKEKGCAILAATSDGRVSEKRYKNYLKMKSESTFNEMSYHEKRQKDKDMGKFIRNTLKEKGKWR